MPQIGSYVSPTRRAAAIRIYGRPIVFELRRLYVYSEFVVGSSPGFWRDEHTSPPGYSCRKDAVEGVDPSFHALEDVVDLSYSKQMPWSFIKLRHNPIQDLMHVPLAVTERSADGHTVERKRFNELCTLSPKILEPAALDYAVDGLSYVVVLQGASGPFVRPFHGFFGVIVIRKRRGAFVKGHDDVRAQVGLNLHGRFGIEKLPGAIIEGLEGDTPICDLC